MQALRSVPAFLFGFLILMMFWLAHRKWSIRYGLDTTTANLLSLALVFIILIYVYPLRAMAQSAVSAITGGWLLPTFQITSLQQLREMFAIYGIGFLVANLCIAGLYVHAFKQRDVIGLSEQEIHLTRDEIWTWLLLGAAGLLSATLALSLPGKLVGLAGWLYFSLIIVMPLWHRWRHQAFLAAFPGTQD